MSAKMTLSLEVKLGSVLVHVQELLSPEGHPVDRQALESLLSDPEVTAFQEALEAKALLPLRRVLAGT